MDYFKMNYNKLENIKIIKFYKIVIIILFLLFILVILSFNFKIYEKSMCYGIYNSNILQIKINSELSDKLKSSQYIKFNNRKTKFKISNYNNYEIIDNEIYQEINLILDKNFIHNEIGLVEFYYDKKTIFKYIFDLFK